GKRANRSWPVAGGTPVFESADGRDDERDAEHRRPRWVYAPATAPGTDRLRNLTTRQPVQLPGAGRIASVSPDARSDRRAGQIRGGGAAADCGIRAAHEGEGFCPVY